MLSMPEIDGIRRMDREGATPAEIARATNHDPKTVRKYIEMDDFSPKPPEKVERPSILDPHKPFIDEILTGDLKVRRKQCHSGTRIFERLRDERVFWFTKIGTTCLTENGTTCLTEWSHHMR